MKEETGAEKKSFQKISYKTLALGGSLFVLILLGALVFFVYGLPRSSAGSPRVEALLPFPVAVVDWKAVITFRELSQNIGAVRRFYEAQDFSQIGLRVDFSTPEGQKRFKIREKEVFNKMLEDEAIEILARERGIRITKAMASEGLARRLEEYGSAEQVRTNLDRLYGWSLEDFEEKIVLPGLYEEKLVALFEKDEASRLAAREKIEAAEKALAERMGFTDIAKTYSEGETAEDGGELGWFTLADLAPELQSAVSSQKVGVPGDIIESSLGFHIILVQEKKLENERELYHLSQIFVKKALFSDWLTEKMRAMNISVWSPEYFFDQEAARIEFRDAELRNFEEEMLKTNGDDASFFF